MGFSIRLHHTNDEVAAHAVAGVMHRAGVRRPQERLLVFFPSPSGLEDRMHPGVPVARLDHRDATCIAHPFGHQGCRNGESQSLQSRRYLQLRDQRGNHAPLAGRLKEAGPPWLGCQQSVNRHGRDLPARLRQDRMQKKPRPRSIAGGVSSCEGRGVPGGGMGSNGRTFGQINE